MEADKLWMDIEGWEKAVFVRLDATKKDLPTPMEGLQLIQVTKAVTFNPEGQQPAESFMEDLVEKLKKIKLLLRAVVRMAQADLNAATWLIRLASRDPALLEEWMGAGPVAGSGAYELERLLSDWFEREVPFMVRFTVTPKETTVGFLFHGATLYRLDYEEKLGRFLWERMGEGWQNVTDGAGNPIQEMPKFEWIEYSDDLTLAEGARLPWSDDTIGSWIAVSLPGKRGDPDWRKVMAVASGARYFSPAVLQEMREMTSVRHSATRAGG